MAAMSHAMRPTAAAAAARDTHMRAVEQGEWSQSGRGRGREGGERSHIRCGSQQRALAPGGPTRVAVGGSSSSRTGPTHEGCGAG